MTATTATVATAIPEYIPVLTDYPVQGLTIIGESR